MEKQGIKEMLEVLDAIECLAVKVAAASKDGFGVEDLKLALDSEIWVKLQAAAVGYNLLPAEVADLDEEELAQIAAKSIKTGFMVFKALKGAKGASAPVA